MRKLNTHFYDGQLHPRFVEIQTIIKNPLSLDQTYKEIALLIDNKLKQKPKQRQQAMMILQRLQTDRGKSANHDQKNHIHVDQLLPLVWTCVKEYDESGQSLFLEQLIEIQGGMCPQGRTARLLQMVELPSLDNDQK